MTTEKSRAAGRTCCPHGIHWDNACGACIPPRGTRAVSFTRSAFRNGSRWTTFNVRTEDADEAEHRLRGASANEPEKKS